MSAGVEDRLRTGLVRLGLAIAVALLAITSIGLAAGAAFLFLEAAAGRQVALVALSAAFGLVAVAVWWLDRAANRRKSARRTAALLAASPISPAADQALAGLIAANGSLPRLALLAANQFARDLTPRQLLLVALIGGLFAGRTFGK